MCVYGKFGLVPITTYTCITSAKQKILQKVHHRTEFETEFQHVDRRFQSNLTCSYKSGGLPLQSMISFMLLLQVCWPKIIQSDCIFVSLTYQGHCIFSA